MGSHVYRGPMVKIKIWLPKLIEIAREYTEP